MAPEARRTDDMSEFDEMVEPEMDEMEEVEAAEVEETPAPRG